MPFSPYRSPGLGFALLWFKELPATPKSRDIAVQNKLDPGLDKLTDLVPAFLKCRKGHPYFCISETRDCLFKVNLAIYVQSRRDWLYSPRGGDVAGPAQCVEDAPSDSSFDPAGIAQLIQQPSGAVL